MANLELAKKRLETAILRLEALVNANAAASASSGAETRAPAESPKLPTNAAPIRAENDALLDQLDSVHKENVRLRQSLDEMGGRLDRIIVRLDDVVSGEMGV